MQSCGLHTSLQERTGWHSWLPASRGIQPFHLYVHFTGTFLCFGPSKTRRQESVENWGGRVESSGTGTWRVSVKMQSLQHQGKTAGLHGYFVERKKAEGWRPEWGVITDLNEMEVRKDIFAQGGKYLIFTSPSLSLPNFHILSLYPLSASPLARQIREGVAWSKCVCGLLYE